MSIASTASPDNLATVVTSPAPPPPASENKLGWVMPFVVLGAAYGLLALTFSSHLSHEEIMQRCVLIDPKMARIWSVGNIEIGVAYAGVFSAMLFAFLKLYRHNAMHLKDLGYALAYVAGSFAIDVLCVRAFEPFVAMLVGDAVVMTFTLIVSRQVWFQRLLGVFVPIIFLTCGVGHLLEGASYWFLTYPANVPWTMVTADVGFAVLVNSARFPAFIRGEDIVNELAAQRTRADQLQQEVTARIKAEAEAQALAEQLKTSTQQQRRFLRDVLASVTEGRLRFCEDRDDLPRILSEPVFTIALTEESLRAVRRSVTKATSGLGLDPLCVHDLITAVGEATMNAVVHGGGGTASLYIVEESSPLRVQVWIEDQGQGIDMEQLPRATLERGFSSRGTLGQGFWLMLKTVDRVFLHTNPAGTTIVLEQSRGDSEAPVWAPSTPVA